MRLKNNRTLSFCFSLWWVLPFIGETWAFSRITPLPHRHTRQLTLQTKFHAQPSPTDEVTTKIDHISEDEESAGVVQFQSGFLVLVSVPFAWGTFEPAVRYVYNVAPQIPTLVFSVAYYAVAVIGLFAVLTYENSKNTGEAQRFDEEKAVSGGVELGTVSICRMIATLGLCIGFASHPFLFYSIYSWVMLFKFLDSGQSLRIEQLSCYS